MSLSFKVIIPARFASTRLPGKPLLLIGDKPLIQHVYESARSSQAEQVLIATDDERIAEAVRSFSAEVMLTSGNHHSATDRIAEVVERSAMPEETVVINLQGDEYGMNPAVINQLATALLNYPDKQMATVCEILTSKSDLDNPNVVKTLFDRNNNAIYFSRLPVPWSAELKEQINVLNHYRHIGMYAYRAGFLREFTTLPVNELELSEKLEQLRALYNGYKIHIDIACAPTGIGVDTEEDLAKAQEMFSLKHSSKTDA